MRGRISSNVCGYEKLRPTGAIWVEALQEPNLISAVIRPRVAKRNESATWSERSGEVQKIFFVLYSLDMLSSFLINLIFFALKNERGVRGEFHFFKTPL